MTSPISVRILLADSQPIVMHGLRALLKEQEDFVIVDMLTTATGLVDAVQSRQPDILLMDLQIKDGQGMELIRELSLIQDLSTRIAILTAELTHTETCELIKYGVNGVLLKDMPTNLIMQCLRSVYAGNRWLERHSTTLALERILQAEASYQDIARQLSKRELELATLIAKGTANKLAATTLNLSEGSVRTYLNRIYTKLNLANRLELSLYFRARGLI